MGVSNAFPVPLLKLQAPPRLGVAVHQEPAPTVPFVQLLKVRHPLQTAGDADPTRDKQTVNLLKLAKTGSQLEPTRATVNLCFEEPHNPLTIESTDILS